jgi:ATP synthase protein I
MGMLRTNLKATGSYATVGMDIVLSIVLGFLAGHWLDGHFDTGPYLTLLCLSFGLATAIRFLYRATRRANQEMAKDGFKESSVGRDARFALDQKDNERRARDSS